MSRARLVITAVVVEGRGVREVARDYDLSPGWVSRLVARYRDEGEAAFEPRSRRPKRSPRATSAESVELIIDLRCRLVAAGNDAGLETIRWHLVHHHGVELSAATIGRYLHRAGLVTPQPHKRPRSSASVPNTAAPASSSSCTTSTYVSPTPRPVSSSANSPSTRPRTTNHSAAHPDPNPADQPNKGSSVSYVSRHHMSAPGRIRTFDRRIRSPML